MGFDDRRPPSRELLEECVHCGFCLPSCPTYALWGEEADSPRGRIHLMSQVLGGAPLAGTVLTHLDRCLSCMACVSACPSGVRYDELIEATRAQAERAVRRPWRERLLRSVLFGLFPYPRRLRYARAALRGAEVTRLRALLGHDRVASKLPVLVKALDSLAPRLGPIEHVPSLVEAVGERRGTVGLLAGCVQSVFFSEVNAATARVLAAEGFDVVVPRHQPCCGALSGHVGREAEAIRFAKATIDLFEASGVDIVVVNAAGCGSAMKAYGRLLSDDPDYASRAATMAGRIRDLSELLVDVGPRARRHPLAVTVAYHDACHLSHAQGIRAQPRALLGAVPGLLLREIPDGDLCCGSAGVYNLFQIEAARSLGQAKAERVLSTGATVLVTSNPGCLMQITAAAAAAGSPLPGVHIAQILDASLRGVPLVLAPDQGRAARPALRSHT